MATWYLEKNGLKFDVEADSKEEAIDKVLAYFDELPDADLPQVGDLDEYERSLLETELAENQKAQAEAARALEGAEDSLGENLLEGAGKAAATANQLVLEGADFVTSPVRAMFGGGSVMDLMGAVDPRLDPRNVEGPEEGYANLAAQAAGVAPVAAAAVAPRAVEGATKVGDIFMDFLGAGSTESRMIGTNLAEQAALAKTAEQTMDARVLKDPTKAPNAARRDPTQQYDFSSDEGVARAAQDISDEKMYEANAVNMPEFDDAKAATEELWTKIQKLDKSIAKAEEAGRKTAVEKLEQRKAAVMEEVDEIAAAAPEFDPKVRILETLSELEARYGLNPVEAQKQISRQGGLKPAKGFDEVRERTAARNAMDYDGDAEVAGWLRRAVSPVSELVAKNVGGIIGRKFENAFETAARNSELLTTKYLQNPAPLTQLAKWAETADVKAQFLDLRTDGTVGKNRLIALATSQLGEDAGRTLSSLFADAAKHQKESSRIYRKDVVKDEVYWPSALRIVDDEVEGLSSSASIPKGTPGAQARARKMGRDMEAEELAEYESPISTLISRMASEQSLIQLAKQYELPPSLATGDNTDEFFDALESKFRRESKDARKAAIGRKLIEETYRGTRKRPAKGVELFMRQSYAGTLGQLDSAILNLHDVAVSMMRNGTRPTLRALMDRGFDIRELGITNTSRSMGEFQEGFDAAADRGLTERFLEGYQNVAFKFSGFRDLDRLGKGTVLRAALNMAQDSANKGTLMKDFGYMMKPAELAQLNTVLKNRTALKDMTEKQRELATQLMFSRLGEQQLISAAGRPLQYLKNPNFRWLYAMTGFAIKQGEMMKKGVVDNIQKGDYKAAGEFTYRYMMFAGIGYGLINQARGSIQWAMGNEDKKPSLAGVAGDALFQPLAAVTFNRLGDEYSVQQFKRDPVGALTDSFEPPLGLVGNLSKDAAALLFDNEVKLKTLNSFPGGDELRALLND